MSDVVIRPLAGLEDRQACVALQRKVWGDFDDLVPASILMIAQETGGVASGAFLGDRLVGFVFGLSGVREGRPTHWSDMLAVDPEHRGEGIGFRLKLHQRERLLEAGIETVRWTFDPLEAANAHLNLRRLGATASEYRRDVYGASPSPLHAGIGTDRLVASWAIRSDRVGRRLRGASEPAPAGPAAVLNPPILAGAVPRPGQIAGEPTGERVRVVVPSDIQGMKEADLAAAVEWRANVRTAFESAFREGYTAVDLEWSGPVARYVLVRGFDR